MSPLRINTQKQASEEKGPPRKSSREDSQTSKGSWRPLTPGSSNKAPPTISRIPTRPIEDPPGSVLQTPRYAYSPQPSPMLMSYTEDSLLGSGEVEFLESLGSSQTLER